MSRFQVTGSHGVVAIRDSGALVVFLPPEQAESLAAEIARAATQARSSSEECPYCNQCGPGDVVA